MTWTAQWKEHFSNTQMMDIWSSNLKHVLCIGKRSNINEIWVCGKQPIRDIISLSLRGNTSYCSYEKHKPQQYKILNISWHSRCFTVVSNIFVCIYLYIFIVQAIVCGRFILVWGAGGKRFKVCSRWESSSTQGGRFEPIVINGVK